MSHQTTKLVLNKKTSQFIDYMIDATCVTSEELQKEFYCIECNNSSKSNLAI